MTPACPACCFSVPHLCSAARLLMLSCSARLVAFVRSCSRLAYQINHASASGCLKLQPLPVASLTIVQSINLLLHVHALGGGHAFMPAGRRRVAAAAAATHAASGSPHPLHRASLIVFDSCNLLDLCPAAPASSLSAPSQHLPAAMAPRSRFPANEAILNTPAAVSIADLPESVLAHTLGLT